MRSTHAEGAPKLDPDVRRVLDGTSIAHLATVLRRDPRLALSIAPVDDPLEPVVIRGRVVERLDVDIAWEIIDRIATSTSACLPPGAGACRAVIEPERQIVGVG